MIGAFILMVLLRLPTGAAENLASTAPMPPENGTTPTVPLFRSIGKYQRLFDTLNTINAGISPVGAAPGLKSLGQAVEAIQAAEAIRAAAPDGLAGTKAVFNPVDSQATLAPGRTRSAYSKELDAMVTWRVPPLKPPGYRPPAQEAAVAQEQRRLKDYKYTIFGKERRARRAATKPKLMREEAEARTSSPPDLTALFNNKRPQMGALVNLDLGAVVIL